MISPVCTRFLSQVFLLVLSLLLLSSSVSSVSYRLTDPAKLALLDSSLVTKYQDYRLLCDSYDSSFSLYWTIDTDHSLIRIAMRARTEGWLGIGISKAGLMIQSDVYVGWVTDSSNSFQAPSGLEQFNAPEGRAYLGDYFFGSRQHLCPVGICEDHNQKGTNDAFNVTGRQRNGWTTIEFVRYLSTGDKDLDYDIVPGQTYLIWALSYDNNDVLQYHTVSHRGQLKHYWYTDSIANTLVSKATMEVQNQERSRLAALGNPSSWITFGELLAIHFVLLISHILSVYMVRFMRAFKLFLLIHNILISFTALWAVLTLIVSARWIDDWNIRPSNTAVTDLGFFICSILYPLFLMITFVSFLFSRHYAVQLTKSRLAAQINQEPVDFSISHVNSLHRVTDSIYRGLEIVFLGLGYVCVNLGLGSSFEGSSGKSDSHYAGFWLLMGSFLACFAIQEAITIYLRLYISMKQTRQSVSDNGTSAAQQAQINEKARANAPVAHPFIMKAALVQFVGLAIAAVLSILFISNSFDTDSSSSYPRGSSLSPLLGAIQSSRASAQAASSYASAPWPPVDPNAKQFLRTYYVAADEVEWDYAPQGLVNVPPLPTTFSPGEYDSPQSFVVRDATHLGSKSKKAIYRRYTDETFTQLAPVEPGEEHLGIVSVLIRAQVGDTIDIIFKNNATRPYTLHPHTVFYSKRDEGVYYGSDGSKKQADDYVTPGSVVRYIWPVPVRSGPSANETSDSVVWFIHSHVNELKDFNAGLLAAIIVYRIGACDINRRSTTVDREFLLSYLLIDENESPYYQDNLLKHSQLMGIPLANLQTGYYTPYPQEVIPFPPSPWHNSNNRYTINGLLYGNIPGLVFFSGEKVRFYVNAFGGTMTGFTHTVTWHGHTVLRGSQRLDGLIADAGSMFVVDMIPTDPGNYFLDCAFNSHFRGGSIANFTVLPNPAVPSSKSQLDIATPIVYNIAADQVDWNYIPNGIRVDNTGRIIADPNTTPIPPGSTPSLKKGQYRQYTDNTFTTLVAQPSHLGILGPVIRAEVSQTVKIVFKNNLPFPCNIVPRGGVRVFNSSLQAQDSRMEYVGVAPGAVATFYWLFTEQSGPAPDSKDSSIGWLYSSTVDQLAHQNAGLIGPIVVMIPGSAAYLDPMNSFAKTPLLGQRSLIPQSIPADIDNEFFLVWTLFDEMHSAFAATNAGAIAILYRNLSRYDQGFGTTLPTVNGYLFGNLDGLNMKTNQHVRWYMHALGDNADVHSPVFHGNPTHENGKVSSMVSLVAGASGTYNMFTFNPGKFLIMCHAVVHTWDGQSVFYQVTGPRVSDGGQIGGKHRKYYIGIDMIMWDYNPLGKEGVFNLSYGTGGHWDRHYDPTPDMRFKTATGAYGTPKLTTRWLKLVYQEYTDATFTTVKPPSPQYRHKGFNGPVIRGEVGDTFEITVKNNAFFPPVPPPLKNPDGFNLMPHGGIDVQDEAYWNSRPIAFGETATYNWYAGVSAAPGPNDPSSLAYLYHSTVDIEKDLFSGLNGIIIIDKKNSTYIDAQGEVHPIGIQNEIIMGFSTMAEPFSHLFGATYFSAQPPFPPVGVPCADANAAPYCQAECAASAFNCFIAGPGSYIGLYGVMQMIMESINGYVFGGQTGINDVVVQEGTTARFYLFSVGASQDIHTIHFHAQAGMDQNGRQLDVIELKPSQTLVYDMLPDNPGRWMIHCHINLHLVMGMISSFVVVPRSLDYYKYSGIYDMNRGGLTQSVAAKAVKAGSLPVWVSWNILPDTREIEITLSREGNGWLAIGIGQGMVGADIIKCAFNDANTAALCEDMYADSHSAPKADTQLGGSSNVKLVSSQVSDSMGRTSFTFIRPLAASDSLDSSFSTGGETPIILAYGSGKAFDYHSPSSRAATAINFFSGASVDSVSVSTATLYNGSHFYAVHGIAMSVAWLLFAPIAFFIARYFRNHSWWLAAHRTLNSICALITLIFGSGMVVLHPVITVRTLHGYLGLFIMGIVSLQVCSGLMTLLIKLQTTNILRMGRTPAAKQTSPQTNFKTIRKPQNSNMPAGGQSSTHGPANLALPSSQASPIVSPMAVSAHGFTASVQENSQSDKSNGVRKGNFTAPQTTKNFILRSVFYFGSVTITAGFHRFIGFVLIIAGFVQILLGLNLLYPSNIGVESELNGYQGAVGAWICLLGLLFLFFEETRRLRLFTFLYRSRGYQQLNQSPAFQQPSHADSQSLKPGPNRSSQPRAVTPGKDERSSIAVHPANGPSVPGGHEGDDCIRMTRREFNDLVADGRMLVVMNNGVYDIEEFVELHPGGEITLRNVVGMDITNNFLNGGLSPTGHSHIHSAIARSIIQDYFVAWLVIDTELGKLKSQQVLKEEADQAVSIHDHVRMASQSALLGKDSRATDADPKREDLSTLELDEKQNSAAQPSAPSAAMAAAAAAAVNNYTIPEAT